MKHNHSVFHNNDNEIIKSASWHKFNAHLNESWFKRSKTFINNFSLSFSWGMLSMFFNVIYFLKINLIFKAYLLNVAIFLDGLQNFNSSSRSICVINSLKKDSILRNCIDFFFFFFFCGAFKVFCTLLNTREKCIP